MTTIGFVGSSSREKTFLMMYLGKILSSGHQVCLVTEDRWMTPILDAYEYNDRFMINKEQPEEDLDYCLLDLTKEGGVNLDHGFFVTGIDRQSVERNKILFQDFDHLNDKTYILLNLIMDSKINEKFLCHKFGLSLKEDRIHRQYMNDNDLSVMVENGYNEQLDLKSMSKIYKKFLMQVVNQVTDASAKEQKRWMRQAERSQ